MKVLYIAGSGRCGSTVLSQLLGEIEEFVNIGELRYLFNTQMRQRDQPCSCGRQPYECAFWRDYIQEIPEEVVQWATDMLRTRNFPLLKLKHTLTGKDQNLNAFLSVITKLYHRISEETGAKVIVDTSKHPVFLWALGLVDDVELFVLHLIRDPRDVVTSWSKPKGYLRERSSLQVSLQWILYNMLPEILYAQTKKYMRLRYEDFLGQPLDSVRTIITFLQEDSGLIHSLRYEENNRFELTRTQHILAGNPDKQSRSRFLMIEPRLSKRNQLRDIGVSLLCSPFLLRYGYLTNGLNK
jgi:hypothetical protein